MENINEKIKESFFNLKLALKCVLDSKDQDGFTSPSSYYLEVPRNSYIYWYVEEIDEYFSEYAQQINKGQLWFEIAGVPVPWDTPFGVFFDQVSHLLRDQAPVEVVVHYRGIPEDLLISGN